MTPSADFLRGFFTAIGLMFLVWLVRWFWGEISRMWKKQVVEHTTSKTPLDVVKTSIANLLMAIVIVGLAIVIFYLIANK
jgi:flagellar biosynthesis protein FlhB